MPTLHQFVASHFNEKARWALDFKGLAHERVSYLPGPHVPAIRKLSGGSTSTPVLEHDGGCVPGSAAIIDWLETHHPDPPLYPPPGAARDAALAFQSRWDAEVGPATRTAAFSVFLDEPGYLCATFSHGKPWLTRAGYRATFPLARPLIRKANGVYPDNVERSFGVVRAALDEVAEATAATGYLAGGAFTVADLTAAALLAPLADLDHPDMRRLRPIPARFAAFIERWREHPAIDWVQRMYATHRPTHR